MLILWLPPCILDRVQNVVPNTCQWEPSKNKEFVIVVASIGHHGAFLIMVICYIRVLWVLIKRSKVTLTRKSKIQPTSSKQNTEMVDALSGDEESQQSSSDKQEASGSNTVHKSGPQQQNVWTINGENKGSIDNKVVGTSADSSDTHKTTHNTASSNRYGVHLKPIDMRQELSTEFLTTENEQALILKSDSKIKPKAKLKRKDTFSKYERNERRVFVTLTYIIIGYIICWVPFHVIFDISSVDPDAVPNVVFTITFWMTYLNSTINPLLYNFSSQEFRTAFKEILSIRCKK